MAKKRSRRTKPRRSRNRFWLKLTFLLTIVGLAVLGVYAYQLDKVVQSKFEGKRWSVPSRVYARALELYPQQMLAPEALHAELKLIGYQPSADGLTKGTYLRRGNLFVITTRTFRHWDSEEPSRSIRLEIANNQVQTLVDASNGATLTLVRLEPMTIGIIHPANQEDRVLVRYDELPPHLLTALQAVEDRNFATHDGIDFRGIARAAWSNVRAGKVVQGGSTLTQQLVKNFYLDSERTLARKFNEAIMALLLERHYDKQAILEAYANEIYLGQDGGRAIHGFGLAANFYFGKPPQELTLADSALLVAMVRGPIYYDPRRQPERALARRNMVIETMLADGHINLREATLAQKAPLGVTPKPKLGSGLYPAFMGLVRRQLKQDYREEDLRNEGLRIFTTLDPVVQETAEAALSSRIEAIERGRGIKPGTLEGGVVITHVGSAEISAVVGGRQPRFEGFNRAIDIQRPVGSLLKPAVFLTALEQPQRYTLATPISDAPVELKQPNGSRWTPGNYDGISHGAVPLVLALANSYNLATVNLGLELGIDNVVKTLKRLGIEREIPAYPSVLLGAIEMAPLDVAQMYQTLADEGFTTPLRAVREVLDTRHQPLNRYQLTTKQRFSAEHVYLINNAMRMALRDGTGRSIGQQLPPWLALAGKTGTTDDLRDSWFAGFGSDYSGVVWIGKDDNGVTGLTGASGALTVWGEIMRRISLTEDPAMPPLDIEMAEIDMETGLLGGLGCEQSQVLPFIRGSEPTDFAPCAGGEIQQSVGDLMDTFKGLFQ